ncbi:MAG TPA: hypothetical protein V6D33_01560 [Cyanophyceae cyanobacterium]
MASDLPHWGVTCLVDGWVYCQLPEILGANAFSELKRLSVKPMAGIPKNQPQFQLIVNFHTGRKIGRIYFPKLYIYHHDEQLRNWLNQKKIYFTQKDVKLYDDGSFRLYFEAPQSEYETLNQTFPD